MSAIAYPRAELLLIILPDLRCYRILWHPTVQSFRCAVQVRFWWSKVVVKSGSLIVIAAHLATHSLPICICPDGPTTIPPNVFMASILNSRSKPSGLPRTTNTLILTEQSSCVDTVTIPTPQHRRDMPPIVMTSTDALFQDRYRSALMIIREQPRSINVEHCAPST